MEEKVLKWFIFVFFFNITKTWHLNVGVENLLCPLYIVMDDDRLSSHRVKYSTVLSFRYVEFIVKEPLMIKWSFYSFSDIYLKSK